MNVTESQIKTKISDEVWNLLWSNFDNPINHQIRSEVAEHIIRQVDIGIWGELYNKFWGQIRHGIMTQVKAGMIGETEA